MSETTNQITRREILKRGAFVGGAVVWATPVVQTLGMGRAFAQTPSDVCVDTEAKWVIDYSPGPQKGTLVDGPLPNGPAVATGRDIPESILDNTDSFVSLGYGGSIVVELAVPYFSGKDGSALVVETTFNAPGDPEEKAEVWVAQTLGSWTRLTSPPYASNLTAPQTTTEFDLDPQIPGPPYVIKYVKLVDATDLTLGWPAHSDGFDATKVLIKCKGPQ